MNREGYGQSNEEKGKRKEKKQEEQKQRKRDKLKLWSLPRRSFMRASTMGRCDGIMMIYVMVINIPRRIPRWPWRWSRPGRHSCGGNWPIRRPSRRCSRTCGRSCSWSSGSVHWRFRWPGGEICLFPRVRSGAGLCRLWDRQPSAVSGCFGSASWASPGRRSRLARRSSWCTCYRRVIWTRSKCSSLWVWWRCCSGSRELRSGRWTGS